MLPLAVLLAAAAPPDPAKAFEDRMVRAVEACERGVVAVAVSHRSYGDKPADDRPGQLGRYDPQGGRGFGGFGRRPPGPEAPDPKNLADPQAAADNAFGSGLVLAPDLVLTAYHLIDGATKVYVRAAGGAGSYADILAADARCDLAVLRLLDPPDGAEPVRFAAVRVARGPRGEPPTVRRGQWVIAVGHPLAAGFADGSPSASWGVLSNVRRRLATAAPAGSDNRSRPLAAYPTLLQTDARVTLGGSGGGLFNLDGELLGMTSSLAGVTGAETAGGYAVPFDPGVRRAVDALRQGREVEYGFLGVRLDGGGGGAGVVLNAVSPGLPAEQAGLKGGDTITAIDGQPVLGPDDLFLHVGAALAGTEVRVRYERAGRPREATATLAKQPHALPRVVTAKRPAVFGLRADWGSVLAANQGADGPPVPAGVLVRELEPDSPAEVKLRPLGDGVAGRWLVTAVDGRPVPTPAAFEAAAAGKESVRLTLHDSVSGQVREVTLP